MNETIDGTIILLHAAVVDYRSLAIYGRRLAKLGFMVHNLGYQNRELNVFDCAESLLAAFKNRANKSNRPIHLIGHSMGGLVARRLVYLHRPENLGGIVTLGTPHLGSPLADLLHKYKFYQKLFGPAGQDLVTGRPIDWVAPWPPPCPIGLIAGGLPVGPGSLNLPRPHDGTVTKASAQPDGGTDYATVPATHTTLHLLKRTARLSARFLRTGRFS